MKSSPSDARQSQPDLRSPEQARVGIVTLVLISFVVGLAASALWHFRDSSKQRFAGADAQPIELSDGSKAVLNGLNSPVEIRFYSLLDPTSVSESTRSFATRVDQLLSEYKQKAGNMVAVKRFTALSTDADAASADGIKPFNMDKGDACYLGITITRDGQKESLPRLDAEWEQALESDLGRAIARLSAPTGPTKAVGADTSQPDKAVVEAVKRAIPDLASVSVEEGTRILREAAMSEFSTAAAEMQNRVKEAQENLVRAQANSSEAGQQAAMKQFQQVQAGQTEKLKEITARLQAQIAALEKMKRQ